MPDDTTPHYHKPTDTHDTVDFPYAADGVRLLATVLIDANSRRTRWRRRRGGQRARRCMPHPGLTSNPVEARTARWGGKDELNVDVAARRAGRLRDGDGRKFHEAIDSSAASTASWSTFFAASKDGFTEHITMRGYT